MGQKKYPDELRERATRMALDALADPARATGAIRRIGEGLGVHPEALRTWVKKAQVDGGPRPGTATDQAQRIKELEKEVREPRRANATLKSASAFFAAKCDLIHGKSRKLTPSAPSSTSGVSKPTCQQPPNPRNQHQPPRPRTRRAI